MKLYTLWLKEPDSIDESPYIIEAWDEYAANYNPEGYDEAVQKAIKEHGGENIRILEVEIPIQAVRDLWKVPKVKGKVSK